MKNQAIRVLLIEDNPGDARFVREALAEAGAQAFDLVWAPDLARGLAHLASNPVDAILLDLGLPDSSGFDTCERVRAQAAQIPTILLTGLDDEALASQAVRQGAQDYLVKGDVGGRLLSRVIRYAIERKLAETRLRKLNRAYAMLSEVNQAIVRLREPLALFDKVCQIAIQVGGLRMAWIGLVDESSQQLQVVAQAGGAEAYFEQAGVTLRDALVDDCPIQNALRGGQRTICNTMGRDALCQKIAFQLGCRSSAALPLLVSGKIRGVVNFYSGEPDFFDEEEIKLLDALALDLSFAMEFAEQEAERQRAEEALRESKDKFKYVFDYSAIGKSITLPSGEISVNKALCDMLGYTLEEFHKRWQDITHPDDIELTQRAIDSLLSGEQDSARFSKRYIHKDGTVVWADVSTSLRRDKDGKPLYFMTTVSDITERKQAEARLYHLNEVLRAVRNVNQLITRERDPQQLMSDACAILVQTRGYRMAWIGLIEAGHSRVTPAARAGQGTDYVDQVTLTWDESETGQGPTGAALRTRQPAVCADTATDPRFAPWREAALQRGFASVAAAPVLHGERLFGVVNVYADKPEAFDDEEISLLAKLAGDLGFALQSIEDEARRKRAEDAIRNRNQMLLAIHKVMLKIGAELYLPVLFSNIMEQAQVLLGAERGGGIYLYESGENVMRLAYGSGINQGREGVTIQIDKGVAGRVYQTSQPVVIDDYTHWDERATVLVADPPSTVMGVPLFLHDKVIGVLLLIANSRLRKFTDQDVQQAEMFAAQAAVAIQNGLLYQQARQEITERTRAEAQLAEQLDELRRWHQATLGRETRILDLKREVNELLAGAGQPPRYPSAEAQNAGAYR